MFGWFKPECPVELERKAWIEFRMRWLVEQLGIERLRKVQVITPTAEFFPDPYEGSYEEVRSLMDRLAAMMGVSTPIELQIGSEAEMPSALGLYIRGDPSRIMICESILNDPFDVVATLVHELAHEILLGGGLLDNNEADHEQVTDLILIYLGVGIISTNRTLKDRTWLEGGAEFFQIQKSGYLSAIEFGYALALFTYLRGEEKPPWARYLRTDAFHVLKKGIKFLFATGDTILHADKLQKRLHPPLAAEACDLLRDGSPTEQVVTLWQLDRNPLHETCVIDAIAGKLFDPDWTIAATAAEALVPLGEAAVHTIPSLLKTLGSNQTRVRASVLNALGGIRSDSKSVIPAIAFYLRDDNRHVAMCAANALGAFGTEAGRYVAELLAAVDKALWKEPTKSIYWFALALIHIEPNPEQQIRDFFKGGNGEHRAILLETIAELREQG